MPFHYLGSRDVLLCWIKSHAGIRYSGLGATVFFPYGVLRLGHFRTARSGSILSRFVMGSSADVTKM